MDEELEVQIGEIWGSAIDAVTRDVCGAAHGKLVVESRDVHLAAFPAWLQKIPEILKPRNDYSSRTLLRYWEALSPRDRVAALEAMPEFSYKEFLNCVLSKCGRLLNLQARVSLRIRAAC